MVALANQKTAPALGQRVGPVEAVFVDVDNTLYDFEASLARTLSSMHAEFCDALGVRIEPFEAAYWQAVHDARDAEATIHRSVDEWRRVCLTGTLDRLGVAQDGLLARMVEAFNRHRRTAVVPFPGTIEALASVQRRHALGVITNGPSALQRDKLRSFGLLDRLDPALVLVSGELAWSKPTPEIFLEAARRAGAAPERCVMVGDSPEHDMPAAAVGFRTVMVNPRRVPLGPMVHAPTAVVETVADLPAALARFY